MACQKIVSLWLFFGTQLFVLVSALGWYSSWSFCLWQASLCWQASLRQASPQIFEQVFDFSLAHSFLCWRQPLAGTLCGLTGLWQTSLCWQASLSCQASPQIFEQVFEFSLCLSNLLEPSLWLILTLPLYITPSDPSVSRLSASLSDPSVYLSVPLICHAANVMRFDNGLTAKTE